LLQVIIKVIVGPREGLKQQLQDMGAAGASCLQQGQTTLVLDAVLQKQPAEAALTP
jgi:hypothetical protein